VEKSSGLFHVASNQKARSIVNRPFCILFAPPLTDDRLIAPHQFAKGILVSMRQDASDEISVGEGHASGLGWLNVACIFSKMVLASPQWIESVSWEERKVFVNLSRATIEESPASTEESLLTREYEIALHRHYDRKGYWIDEVAAMEYSY
jgi:hypothetical protein